MGSFQRVETLAREKPWLPLLLVGAAVIVYLVQAFHFAHTTISSVDEGAYLYKGWLFATGQYQPFQPYGPWTNKAPLAFLIPGYAQLIFGAGLRTGRYLAVAFGALTVIATWWTARRLAGPWLAVAAAWTMALQPAVIKIYSEGLSQATTIFFLALILLLSVGKDRPVWQLILAGFFAGAVIMVRQNMVLVLPLLILYIWWEYGWRSALYSGAAGFAILLFFLVLYWPNIIKLWINWLPGWLTSLISVKLEIQSTGTSVLNLNPDFQRRLLSFFQGVRFYFVPLVGLASGLILWPKRRNWQADSQFRASVFLVVLFGGLFVMHSWASLSLDYCVFCFTPYLAFYYVCAILFVATLLRVWERNAHMWRQILLVLVLATLIAGVGYSAFEDIGNDLLDLRLIPRVSSGGLHAGYASIWELLANKFALERNPAMRLVSTAAGLLMAMLLFILAYLLYRRMRNTGVNYGYVLAILTLSLGLVSGPLLAGSGGQPECQMDVIAANEQVGAHLANTIPEGSQVFWNGGSSVAPLLYAPELKIYPPQINGIFAKRNGSDPEILLSAGLWNDELRYLWLREADFVIIESRRYSEEDVPAAEFRELPGSNPTSCLPGSQERIFRRK